MLEVMKERHVHDDAREALSEAIEGLDVEQALWGDPSEGLEVLRSVAVLLLHGVILAFDFRESAPTNQERASEVDPVLADMLVEASWKYIRDFLRYEEAVQRGLRHPGRWRRRLLTRLRRIEALLTFPLSNLWLSADW